MPAKAARLIDVVGQRARPRGRLHAGGNGDGERDQPRLMPMSRTVFQSRGASTCQTGSDCSRE